MVQTTLYTKRLIIVIAANRQAPANAIAQQVDTVGGSQAFTVGLSATGNAPATHYWCNWALTVPEHDDLQGRLTALKAAGDATVFDAETTAPEDVLATMGLQRLKGPLE